MPISSSSPPLIPLKRISIWLLSWSWDEPFNGFLFSESYWIYSDRMKWDSFCSFCNSNGRVEDIFRFIGNSVWLVKIWLVEYDLNILLYDSDFRILTSFWLVRELESTTVESVLIWIVGVLGTEFKL